MRAARARPPAGLLVFVAGLALACYLTAVVVAALRYPGGFGQAADEFPGNFFVQAWVRWDAGWYAKIARNGYFYRPGEQSSVAYFPLYPMLLRALGALGLNTYVAGILVSVSAGLLGLRLFWAWASELKGPDLATRATVLLALYPFAFYLYGVVYSDALFFCLVAGAFLALERRHIALAVLLGALATATRPVAPAVVAGLLVRHFELRRKEQTPVGLSELLPLGAAAGLLAYSAFLYVRFGDPFAFATVQSAPGWEQQPGIRTWLKLPLWELLAADFRWTVAFRHGVHGLLALLALLLVWPTRKKLGWGYAVYVFVAVGIPTLSTKDFMGLGRYLLAGFPVFLTLAVLLEPRPWGRRALQLAGGAALLAVTVAFALGIYVA